MILRQAFRFLQDRASGQSWKIKTATGSHGPEIAHIQPALDLNDWKAPRDYAMHDLIYIEDIGAGVDLGNHPGGQILRNRIVELLQHRTGKWTMLDANFTRHEISQKLDPRIASRLKRDGSIVIEVSQDVPDFNDR